MGKLVIDQSKVSKDVADKLMKLCPFGGFEYDGKPWALRPAAGVQTLRAKVRKVSPDFEEEISSRINKANGGCCRVYRTRRTKVHPVSFELIGKAQNWRKINQEVIAVLIAS